MSEFVPEVCREHRDTLCTTCDENNDDLWVHPRDLEPEESEDDGESNEVYEVYVDSGPAHDRFREFCRSLGSAIEISWKDTNYV